MAFVADLQNEFCHAILRNEPAMIAEEILPDGIAPHERYNIYHNNIFVTLGQALARNFPVLCRLVGQAFFDQIARDYVQKYPPVTPLLMSYGAEMAVFLKTYSPASGLPYLSDVARFEHLWTLSFNGPDPEDFDLDNLKNVASEKFNDLVFSFIPNIQFMTSDYPILDIWCANQEGSPGQKTINIDQGGCGFAFYRKAQEVEIMPLDKVDYNFLTRLHSGGVLGNVAGKMMEKYADFNLQEALQKLLVNQLVTDFSFRI